MIAVRKNLRALSAAAHREAADAALPHRVKFDWNGRGWYLRPSPLTTAPPASNERPALIAALELGLATEGVAVMHNLFPLALLLALAAETQAHAMAGRLRPAATGRGEGRQGAGTRGDSTLWLDDPRCGSASGGFLTALEALLVSFNRSLFLGLHEVEAQHAHYPPGAGYARHRDRFRDDDARVLSLVCYLNADWPEDAGGQLRLHLPAGVRDISPCMGTTVVFASDEVEHEVLPATRGRDSIAAWFRRRPHG